MPTTTTPPLDHPVDHPALCFDFPPEFALVAWADPLVESVGFAFDHPYVELLWLPIVGPSSAWMFRRLASRLQRSGDGARVDLAELAAEMGLGASTGRSSIVQRSLRRLTMFGLATWHGRLGVRTAVPPLAQRHLSRLTPGLRATHDALVGPRPG